MATIHAGFDSFTEDQPHAFVESQAHARIQPGVDWEELVGPPVGVGGWYIYKAAYAFWCGTIYATWKGASPPISTDPDNPGWGTFLTPTWQSWVGQQDHLGHQFLHIMGDGHRRRFRNVETVNTISPDFRGWGEEPPWTGSTVLRSTSTFSRYQGVETGTLDEVVSGSGYIPSETPGPWMTLGYPSINLITDTDTELEYELTFTIWCAQFGDHQNVTGTWVMHVHCWNGVTLQSVMDDAEGVYVSCPALSELTESIFKMRADDGSIVDNTHSASPSQTDPLDSGWLADATIVDWPTFVCFQGVRYGIAAEKWYLKQNFWSTLGVLTSTVYTPQPVREPGPDGQPLDYNLEPTWGMDGRQPFLGTPPS